MNSHSHKRKEWELIENPIKIPFEKSIKKSLAHATSR